MRGREEGTWQRLGDHCGLSVLIAGATTSTDAAALRLRLRKQRACWKEILRKK